MTEFKSSIKLNTTIIYSLKKYNFDDLTDEDCIEIYKDGRVFSHFIEKWLSKMFPLKHITGCKSYDFVDKNYSQTLYDQKTFTKNGCYFCPSNMLGQGRVFDQKVFEEKTKKLIFCIVSNINFPEIKIKFVRGTDLLKEYPKGKIKLQDHIKFFN